VTSSLFGLEELPKKAAAVAAQVPGTARELVSVSIDRLIRGLDTWPETMVLTVAKVGWRFFIAKSGTRVVFLFWKKNLPERVLLDATLDMSIVPSDARATPLSMAQVAFRIQIPPFVRQNPSPALLAQIGPSGATPSDTIVLEVGPGERDLLAIRRPERGPSGATITYTVFGRTEQVRPVGGLWRPKPFLALLDALRDWVAVGGGDVVAMRPPAPAERSDAWEILLHVADSYVQASEAVRLRQPPRSAEPTLVDELGVHYDMGPFASTIMLRLKPDGEIAQTEGDDPFQLRMAVTMQRERRGVSADVELKPPDFLASGAIRDGFLDELEGALDELADELRTTPAQARLFLRNARETAVVFRVKRQRKWDTDIVVLAQRLDGDPVVAMLRGQFKVKNGAVKMRAGRLKGLFVGPTHLNDPAIPRDVVRHFLRLAAEIKNWLGVLS